MGNVHSNGVAVAVCRFCGETKPVDQFRPKTKQCMDCRRALLATYRKAPHRLEYKADYMARYRKSPEERVKGKARIALKYAVDRGDVVKPSGCSRCPSTEKIHGHHTDYSQPLDVIWLCNKCHVEEHKRIKEKAL